MDTDLYTRINALFAVYNEPVLEDVLQGSFTPTPIPVFRNISGGIMEHHVFRVTETRLGAVRHARKTALHLKICQKPEGIGGSIAGMLVSSIYVWHTHCYAETASQCFAVSSEADCNADQFFAPGGIFAQRSALRLTMFVHVTRGLHVLNTMLGMAHCSLKGSHILVRAHTNSIVFAIGDLGHMRPLGPCVDFVPDPLYTPPEKLAHDSERCLFVLTASYDVWSLGRYTHQLFHPTTPTAFTTTALHLRSCRNLSRRYARTRFRCDGNIGNLLMRTCLVLKARMRPSPHQVLVNFGIFNTFLTYKEPYLSRWLSHRVRIRLVNGGQVLSTLAPTCMAMLPLEALSRLLDGRVVGSFTSLPEALSLFRG
ncbi:ORF117 [Ranid herpesvirus 1]|uniref:ORF117 n=1 Tax=Ranid herpesvirus 1 TaxID=85655 RepID=Q14VL3_9VIRU|nr:ORF117 [Ranid herpesvirus 1]ABG25748.1 ORF117 [Ranid herpesvirus 1]